jgi:hypothetical protein
MGVAEALFSVAFPVLIGLGAAIALTDASVGEFWVARGFLILAALDMAGLSIYWLWPEFTKPILWRLVAGALVGAVLLSATIFALYWVGVRENRLSTKLVAGNQPTPLTRCYIPNNAFAVFYGSNVSWTTRNDVQTIVKMAGDQMLAMSRSEDGRTGFITALKIFDDRGDIIARIDQDGRWVRSDTRYKRPDPSTLIVYDHYDVEVLNIKFLNSKALSLTGIFRHPKSSNITTITDQYMTAGPIRFMGGCSGNTNTFVDIP